MSISTQRAQWPIPDLTFDGTILQHSDSIKLLGVTFDTHLSYRNHLRAVALRANQRIGFFRKASRVLNRQGRMVTYKGFIRYLLEYAPLVWIGAAQSHIQALDRIQRKAMKIIGDQTLLPTLATRRLVSALTYLYKLQCISGPAQLKSMVPPPALPVPHQRTRAQQGDRHQYQLSCPLPVASPDYLTRSFPYCVLSNWNSLPVNTIQQRPYLKGLQWFKTMVYHHLSHKNWVQSTDLC